MCIHCLTTSGLYSSLTLPWAQAACLSRSLLFLRQTVCTIYLERAFHAFHAWLFLVIQVLSWALAIWNGLLNNSLPYYTNYWYHIVHSWAEELAQQLRASTTQYYLSSIPAPIRWLTMTCNSSSRNSDPLASGCTCIHVHITIDRHTTHKFTEFKNKFTF